MNTSADAAEQVVRMSLETAEVTARITGAGAKQIAVMLYAILKDQNKTRGKARLTSMIKSGKELKVFAVKDKDLSRFCAQAKQYGVLYCVLKDRNATDGITDIMVRAEDVSKVNRIFQRFNLSTTDMASVKSELLKIKEKEAQPSENPIKARAKNENQSGPSLSSKESSDLQPSDKKPSVRKELTDIKNELKAAKNAGKERIPVNPKVKEGR